MMIKSVWHLVTFLSLALPSVEVLADAVVAIPAGVVAAISDPRRAAEQIKLDPTRRPALVIAFSGLKSGDHVADFMPGNAYFTRIFSDVVGPTGRVYAFIPTEQVANCPATEIAGTRTIARDPGYANVTVLTDSVMHFRAPEKLDVLWTAQNYHDLHDSFMGPADVAALNKVSFNALKPGGVFLVIDHVAEPGSGLRDTETCIALTRSACKGRLKRPASFSKRKAVCFGMPTMITNRPFSTRSSEEGRIKSFSDSANHSKFPVSSRAPRRTALVKGF
jgi:predicted methyltransferase